MILVNFRHKIQSQNGVHARPAGYLADLARKYFNVCTIKIGKVLGNGFVSTPNVTSSGDVPRPFPKISVSEQFSCSSGVCQFENVNKSCSTSNELGSFYDVSQILSVMKMGLRKGDEVMFCINGPDDATERKVESELNSLLAEHF